MQTKTLTLKEAKRQVKKIENIWKMIDYTIASDYRGYSKEYYALCLHEEKCHLKGKPYGIINFLSASQSAKIFAVQRILEPLLIEYKPILENYHRMQKSVFYGYSLSIQYREALLNKIMNIDNIKEVLNFNYADLQQVERV